MSREGKSEVPPVLLLINQGKGLEQQFLKLKKCGVTVIVTHNLKEAIKELVTKQPPVFLISWTLKKTDVKKTFSIVSQKFRTHCIVFSEDEDKNSMQALVSSKISNIMLPPYTTEKILKRIEPFINEEIHKELLVKGADAEDVPTKTSWVKIEGASKESENIWKGTAENNGRKKYFYHKGAEAPKLNKEKNKWEGFGKVKILTSDKEDDKKIQKELSKEWQRYDEQEALLAEVGNESFAENEKITVLKPDGHMSELAPDMKLAVARSVKPHKKNESNKINISTKVTVTMVKTKETQGFLVGANAQDVPDKGLMENVLSSLAKQLKAKSSPRISAKIIELELDPVPFMIWVDAMADFYIHSQHGGEDVAFAYLPFENLPHVIEDENKEDYLCVKISNLHPKKALGFDVHIFMPNNHKFLLYLKKGTKLDVSVISKLLRSGLTTIYISKHEEEAFHRYCAKHKIAEAYDDFIVKKTA